MQTVLIRVEATGDHWPMQWFEDDGSVDWTSRPVRSTRAAAIGAARLEEMRQHILEEDQSSPEFERIGEELYEALTHGAVGERWNELSANHNRRLRLLLDMRSDTLGKLPWELVREGPHIHATNIATPVARVSSRFPGQHGELPPIRWPLRLMVVVGSEPDDAKVAAKLEISGLRHAFRDMCGWLDIEILEQESAAKVRDTYRHHRPHIFHFIGHGDVEDGRGRLKLFDTEIEEYAPWDASDIVRDLAGWQPRLALVNACRSSSVDHQDGAWSIAGAFTELGATAVVAMQGDIRGEAAAAFSRGLYGALAEGDALDVAVSNGRAEIARVVRTDHRDFALPSLTVSAPPRGILRTCFGVPHEHRARVETSNRKLRAFVDRAAERRRLWRRIDPDPEPADAEHDDDSGCAPAIAIVGSSQVGKTELARWCVGTCQLHGGNATYVDLARIGRLPFLETLEVIRQELEDSTDLYADGNRSAFAEWDRARERLSNGADGQESQPWPPDSIETLFGAFGDALRSAAGDRPLLIALDHVSGVEDESLKFLCKWLLAPIARHRLQPVRVLVVLSDEQQRIGVLGEDIHEIVPQVELRQFRAKDFYTHAQWYFGYHFDAELDEVDDVTGLLAPVIAADWDWKTIVGLNPIAEGRWPRRTV